MKSEYLKNITKLNVTFLIFFMIFFCKEIAFAQSTVLKLPTTDNSSSFDITKNDSTNILRLFGDGGFYVGGSYDNGVIPTEGPGPRLMWHPPKKWLSEWDMQLMNGMMIK